MNAQTQWLFEAPFTSEAMSAPGAMTREQMRIFLEKTWKDNPILRRIAEAQSMSGRGLSQKLGLILQQFEALTGIRVEKVNDGAVQRLRGIGNLASLRSRPGFLQIEHSVFLNPQTLLTEVRHELAFYFAGGLTGVPHLINTPFSALDLLELTIKGNGELPSLVAKAPSSSESSEYKAEWLFEVPFNQQSLSAKLESPDFMAHSNKGSISRTRRDKHQAGERTDIMNQGGEKADARRPHGKPKPSQAKDEVQKKIDQARITLERLNRKRNKVETDNKLKDRSFRLTQIDKAIGKATAILNHWKQVSGNS